MKKLINLVAGLVAAALLCIASVSPSNAGTTAFVSGRGSDANACTLAQPCRTIGQALIAVAGNGGIVSCLDAGPYTEAFSSPGVFHVGLPGRCIHSGGGFAITVQTALVVLVTFRHVIFDGAPGGGGAIKILGGTVAFENCTFQNFAASSGVGVQFVPTDAGAQLTITDSVFTHNGNSGGGGIVIQPSNGVTANAVIERTQVASNNNGIITDGTGGTVLVEIRYSSIAGNVFDGIWAYTQVRWHPSSSNTAHRSKTAGAASMRKVPMPMYR